MNKNDFQSPSQTGQKCINLRVTAPVQVGGGDRTYFPANRFAIELRDGVFFIDDLELLCQTACTPLNNGVCWEPVKTDVSSLQKSLEKVIEAKAEKSIGKKKGRS